jgi:DNA invertase Pin-like site-specific DNA recombinase
MSRADLLILKSVLVYDVSRWGRFQNADEAAHYEYLCKRAGVSVHYCAEQFENNDSLITTLLKGMKRAMAAEFSRELSVKVLEGQKKLSLLGFRRGGTPGYGLRRMMLDEHGRPKALLAFRQEKNLKTDRVILVPGPAKEVKIVRKIFHLFVHDHISPTDIVRRLNKQGVVNAWGNAWTPNNMFKLLRNESYIGDLVYNRTTAKLFSKRRPNPRSMWIRKNGAFKPIVDLELFEAAQRLLNNSWTFTDGELLDYMTAMLCVNKKLTSRIIKARKYGPSINAYFFRFGRLSNAYRAIGYVYDSETPFLGDTQFKPKQNAQKYGSKTWTHSQFRYRP